MRPVTSGHGKHGKARRKDACTFFPDMVMPWLQRLVFIAKLTQ
jgi:hypothetical protein